MKTRLATADRLIIEDRPWFLWIVLPLLGLPAIYAAFTGRMGSLFETLLVGTLGIGTLWIAWHFAPFQRFTFDRATGTLTHQITRLTGTRTWQTPLTRIERAASEGNWSDGSRLERVTLILRDRETYPMESGFTGFSRKPVIAAINDWLDAPE